MTNHNHLIDNKNKVLKLILLLGSIIAIGPLAIDMYLPAFTNISNLLNASQTKVQLSVTAYFLGMIISQICYGPIIDSYGKKIPLFIGLVIFIFSSIACTLATKIEYLIIARFFQAIGGCACVVIPRAIVRDLFTPKESAKIFSHLMLVMGLAPILAPTFGTILLKLSDFRAIFIFMALYGFICLICSIIFIPQTHQKSQRSSSILNIYSKILRDKNFIFPALTGGFAMAGLFSYITGASFIYQEIYQKSPTIFALVFTINAVFFIIASQVNAFCLKRKPIKKILNQSLTVTLFASLFLLYLSNKNPNIVTLTITILFMLGPIGSINPNTTALCLANYQKNSGSASAMMGTIQFSLAAIASFFVSHFYDGTIFALSTSFSTCMILAFLANKLNSHKS